MQAGAAGAVKVGAEEDVQMEGHIERTAPLPAGSALLYHALRYILDTDGVDLGRGLDLFDDLAERAHVHHLAPPVVLRYKVACGRFNWHGGVSGWGRRGGWHGAGKGAGRLARCAGVQRPGGSVGQPKQPQKTNELCAGRRICSNRPMVDGLRRRNTL